ncbi:Uncharacterized membrane protein [Enhydrobacter aerosaccus]|uniref:Uncharacterized membrane protein n=1 Tax=Enhydrobacter aerosaccus TaxID=225324 RepID=A0A1T4LA22_9HYPH|nr:DUF2254 domain-containing protein [Enhydrobacter aerosaccus]SJZ51484.1 Uncharacterized membrane protein [Enhydrobacter aerosaccus]
MNWNKQYALRSYLRSSMWLVPLAAYVVSLALIRVLGRVDDWLDWSWNWVLEIPAAQSALEVFIAAMLSFIVFTFSSLLVAIQVASAQLTPRIIATTLLRDNTIRFVVALFVLTLAFNLGVLARTQMKIPYLLFTIAFVLSGASVAAFLYLIDYAARLLRPVSIVWRLGEDGLSVLQDVYPVRIEGAHHPSPPMPRLGPADREIAHQGKSAIVLAVDLDTVRKEAERTDGVIEFAHRVGDFVATDEPLFLMHGGAIAADDRLLRSAVAFGPERTIEQDATFAFRVIVDIAVKALSSAINDPTTAVLSIDQLHRLLRAVGRRHLHDDIIRSADGKTRVVFRTPNWEDFVALSCREIRLYGVSNFQVARRLRAMLENLLRTLPEARLPALREELELLDQALDRLAMLPQDLALARTADLQGLGAALRT